MWGDSLPADVVKKQASWQRRRDVLRMRRCGLKLKQCADRLGVSTGRVRQLIARAEREERRDVTSPLQAWLLDTCDALVLFNQLKNPKYIDCN